MGIRSIGQQGIVFAVFAALFAVFAIALPGFLSTANMLTLLQNVAVLGILGLAIAIVVLGRGIRADHVVRGRERLADPVRRGAVALHRAGVGIVSRRVRRGGLVQA